MITSELQAEIENAFLALEGVDKVSMTPISYLEVRVAMSGFSDQEKRCAVYAAERELYQRFPDVQMEFIVEDCS